MAPDYTIETDARQQFITLSLFGRWDQTTIDTYKLDLAKALAAMVKAGGRPGHYLTLIDVREHAVQSQDIAAEFAAIIASHVSLSKRIGIVMSGSALHKMQVVRISAEAQRRYFSDRDEALAWLLD